MRTISPVGSAARAATVPARPSSTSPISRVARFLAIIVSSPASIQTLLVQQINHRIPPSVEIGAQIAAEYLGDLGVLARHRARRMRADQHVGQVPERALRRQRLDRGDVERGEAEMLAA